MKAKTAKKGSWKERNKKAFKEMTLKQKIAYIAEYYRLPLFTACVVLIVAITSVIHAVTKKQPVVYLAYTNAAVGDDLDQKLTSGFLDYIEADQKKFDVLVYRGLYLEEDADAENHRYVYASKMKIMGAISAKQMDLMLMNDSALAELSASGLLMDLTAIKDTDPELYGKLEPYIQKNMVIIEDNAIEYKLNEADTYEAVTEDIPNSVNVTSFPVFREAGLDGTLQIGIIANSPRIEADLKYLAYLLDGQ